MLPSLVAILAFSPYRGHKRHVYRLFLAALLLACSTSFAKEIARSSLIGVWEITSCVSLRSKTQGDTPSITNSKFCFNASEAYPDLSPEVAGDSADGLGSYFIVDGDIVLIRTGVPDGIRIYVIDSVTKDQIVWRDGPLVVTLRRIAKSWVESRAPKIKPKRIPITYLP